MCREKTNPGPKTTRIEEVSPTAMRQMLPHWLAIDPIQDHTPQALPSGPGSMLLFTPHPQTYRRERVRVDPSSGGSPVVAVAGAVPVTRMGTSRVTALPSLSVTVR